MRTPDHTPDCLFPSADDYDIPSLDPMLQADAVPLPFRAWGSVARRSRLRGTWHFYTDDYKFSTVWQTPSLVTNTRCRAVCEVNYSTDDPMPLPVVLWGVYRKRWLARWWQTQGLRILVDLNVSQRWEALNLRGVPAGWRAFSTRASDLPTLARHRDLARQVAGTDSVTLAVYGGGPVVAAFCRETLLHHYPDQGNAARGNRVANRQSNSEATCGAW